jgi:hypothetical protein
LKLNQRFWKLFALYQHVNSLRSWDMESAFTYTQ